MSIHKNSYNPSYEISKIKQYSYNELSQIKQEIELELNQLYSFLESLGIDLNTSLLTKDGFPRNDIDIVEVKYKRISIIKLSNDLKLVIDELQQQLSSLLSKKEHIIPTTTTSTDEESIPFVKVEEVLNTSPCHIAGLKQNDLLISIYNTKGTITVLNHDNLNGLYNFIKANINSVTHWKVKRDDIVLTLEIIPNLNWGNNKSLLGCKLVKL